jgi:hypothetical protein
MMNAPRHPGFDPGSILKSARAHGYRLEAGMTNAPRHPGLDPGSILKSIRSHGLGSGRAR